jgi:hypothetical protein
MDFSFHFQGNAGDFAPAGMLANVAESAWSVGMDSFFDRSAAQVVRIGM